MDPYLLALLLYIAALVLAILDIFVPSGGMLVVLAGASAIGSILFGFRSSITMGMSMLTVVTASIPVCALLAVKLWPHTPIGRRVILKTPASELAMPLGNPNLDGLVGQVFRVESPLLPAGQLKVGHRQLNAIAESGIIESGQIVKVIAIRERNLIVRPTLDPISPVPNTIAPQLEQSQTNQNLLELTAEELGLDSIEADETGS